MTDYIYRAQVKNGGQSITYHNSEGKKVTYSPYDNNPCTKNSGRINYSRRNDAALLFNTINKYFTGESPNITPQEQVQIRADIAKNRPPITGIGVSDGGIYSSLDIYEGIDFVLKTFSDKNSEGGENITPNEVYQMFEMFHNWTK